MANPLDRTWYNTLVDDDGSGNTGTIWNKAQVNGLLNAVDASLATIVDKTGTPVANQIALFNDADTIKADARLTWDPVFAQVVIKSLSGGGRVTFQDSDQPANQQWMRIDHDAQAIRVRAISDAGGVLADPIVAARSGDVTIGRVLTIGGGAVIFPATQIPSASAYAIDDYRRLPWTPFFAGSAGNAGTTYTSQFGRYIKKGREITAWVAMTVATPGTISGGLRIWGLPHLSANEGGPVGSVTIGALSPTNVTFASLSGYVQPGVTTAELTYVPAAGASELLALPGTAVKAGTTIYCEIRYLAAQ